MQVLMWLFDSYMYLPAFLILFQDHYWQNWAHFFSELQAKKLQLDGDRGERSERKRKSRFGDDEDTVPEKTLVPIVSCWHDNLSFYSISF